MCKYYHVPGTWWSLQLASIFFAVGVAVSPSAVVLLVGPVNVVGRYNSYCRVGA